MSRFMLVGIDGILHSYFLVVNKIQYPIQNPTTMFTREYPFELPEARQMLIKGLGMFEIGYTEMRPIYDPRDKGRVIGYRHFLHADDKEMMLT